MKHFLFLAALLLLSQSVYSEPYFGIGVGITSLDEENTDDEAFTGQLYGGYRFNEYLSLELSYIETGAFDTANRQH